MTNPDLERARAAKAKAKKSLSGRSGVVGIGLTKVGGKYAVKVNVSSPEERERLPLDFDGISVRCEYVGEIRKRAS
jgi:hypothetical protein